MSHSPKKPGMHELFLCILILWSYNLLACTLSYIQNIPLNSRPIGIAPVKLTIL